MKRLPIIIAGVLVLAAAGLVEARQANTSQESAPPPAGSEEAPPDVVVPPPPVIAAPPPAVVTPVAPPPEAKAAAQPTTPDKPPEPLRRPRSPFAVLQVLDKVTAETLKFQVPVGGAVRYKTLVFQVRACETNAADEDMTEAAAYLVVTSQPLSAGGGAPPPARQVFKGWMYASSPGLNPLQHPVYDAWVITCSAAPPSAVASR